jgi:hypothetical protein
VKSNSPKTQEILDKYPELNPKYELEIDGQKFSFSKVLTD